MYVTSPLFKIQCLVQLGLIALSYFFSLGETAQAVVCGILLCAIGIPHGSNDYLYRPNKSLTGMFRFLVVYIGTIILYVCFWLVAPSLALAVFFFLSFHHFGQSNFKNSSVWYLPSISWGLWIVVLPLLLHWNEALSVLQQMISSSKKETSTNLFAASSLDLEYWKIGVLIALGILYLAVIFYFERKYFLFYLIQFGVITIWYLLTPLLFGFIVVFCLWHSLQSLQHQSAYFKKVLQGTSWQFMKAMLPFSALALAGFASYLWLLQFSISEAFFLLSIITLPHVVVMHWLYKEIA